MYERSVLMQGLNPSVDLPTIITHEWGGNKTWVMGEGRLPRLGASFPTLRPTYNSRIHVICGRGKRKGKTLVYTLMATKHKWCGEVTSDVWVEWSRLG